LITVVAPHFSLFCQEGVVNISLNSSLA